MEELPDIEPKPLPRWITLLSGVVLLPFSGLCVISSGFILIAPQSADRFLTTTIGSVLLLGSLWVLHLSVRLLFISPKSGKKFIHPLGLRISALIFILIPVISIAVGTFWEKPIMHSIMSIVYFMVAAQLLGIARNRQDSKKKHRKTE